MPVDEERLTRLRRYEDREAELAEEFLARRIGPWRSFVLLTTPLRESRAFGWVICPSLGTEHGNLRRLETLIARSLARSGFPVVRIRPDLTPTRGASGEIDLSARMAEVEEAVTLLREEYGLDAVGLAGMLFGATVAAVTAEHLGARAIALVEPILRGKRYLRETVRRQAVAELMALDEADSGADDASAHQPSSQAFDEFAAAGQIWIRGLRLTQEEYERIAEIDLLEQPLQFRESSLLIDISPYGAISSSATRLRDRLLDLGGTVHVAALDDPLPAPFGEYYYRNVGAVRMDTRLELDQRIASVMTAWAVDTFDEYPRRVAS